MDLNHTELKVWNCSSWKCEQTINFHAADEKKIGMKVQKAIGSSHIMLTEPKNNVMYIVKMGEPDKKHVEMSTIPNRSTSIKFIGEYKFPFPILSAVFFRAAIQHFECTIDNGKSLKNDALVIHSYLFQRQDVYESHFIFKPTMLINPDVSLKPSNIVKPKESFTAINGNSVEVNENSLKYIITPGFRKTSQLIYVTSEQNLFVGKGKRSECVSYLCYQSVLYEKDKDQLKCSARIQINKDGVCQRNNIQHSSHSNHEQIFKDMESANIMKGICEQLQGMVGNSARKISSREIFNRELAT